MPANTVSTTRYLDLLRAATTSALNAMGLSEPNPRVGCVLQSTSGAIFTGHTQQAGGPHAEIVTLSKAREHGTQLAGATVYVTLEPCAHHGRTPPCCDALIEAKVARVVVATIDPNPKVAGRGLDRLRAAGIEVEVLPQYSEHARASRELNIGFFSRMIRKTPWVRMKVAASLDGTTALSNGASQWITGEEARADGHAWRARACAVLTGIGTVLEDDPMLDVRLVAASRQPHLVIVDSRLETPLSARLFQAPAGGLTRQILIYCAESEPNRQKALEALGVQVISLPGPGGKVDLAEMMRDLARREVNELHVEAGHKLNGSLLREGLMDEVLFYMAPKVLGTGAGMFNMGPLERLEDGTELDFHDVSRVGSDLRVTARVRGRDQFLHA